MVFLKTTGRIIPVIASRVDQEAIIALLKCVAVFGLLLYFWRNFRGGRPPRPMHPTPANDSALLLRKRSKPDLD
jgi:hypothetical protein